MTSPIKIFINYKNESKSTSLRDLSIFYSFTGHKPDATNCDGMVENATCLSIEAPNNERIFSKDKIYLKFDTKEGCQANLKLVFPK